MKKKIMEQPTLLNTWNTIKPPDKIIFLHKIIIDRWSKYSVTCIPINTIDEIKTLIKKNTSHKFYTKATHNTYGRRKKREDGAILEWKNDDGEKWAGMCILRELKRANFINWIVIVTRYYGWVKLQNDRFKHVIDATKELINTINSKQKK
jgi:putative IMPACT (imprinted ancient) family translation regulator